MGTITIGRYFICRDYRIGGYGNSKGKGSNKNCCGEVLKLKKTVKHCTNRRIEA